MKVNICGIQHTIIECDDHFDVDTHMGMIDYNKAEIRINKASAQPIKDATICHEVLHGMLVHIGRTDLSTDEPFVTALGNAINGAFVLREDEVPTHGRLIDADEIVNDCEKYIKTLNPDVDGKEISKVRWLIGVLNEQPTIVPEERSNYGK